MSPTRRTRVLPALLAMASMLPAHIRAQAVPQVTLGGELRPRMESRDPGESFLISSRTRLSLNATFEEGLRLFIQPQDVRNWGEEASERDRSADAVDFHQAFLEVIDLPGVGGLLRAGRQEVALAESRFLAAPNWGQAGQTFDGIRWIRSLGQGRLDLTYLAIREEASESHTWDGSFFAAWYSRSLGAPGSVDLLVFRDRDATSWGTDQYTMGAVWKGTLRPLSFRVQAMRQLGEREDRDVEAYMLAGEVRMTLLEGRGSVALWYDHLSGDADPSDDEVGAFSTLYGARNRFYGRADYFTNIPRDTDGMGLRDAALKLSYRPTETLTLNLDLHAFRTAEGGYRESEQLGEELDAWLQYRFRGAMTIQGGYSRVSAGPVMEHLSEPLQDGTFIYLMTSLLF